MILNENQKHIEPTEILFPPGIKDSNISEAGLMPRARRILLRKSSFACWAREDMRRIRPVQQAGGQDGLG